MHHHRDTSSDLAAFITGLHLALFSFPPSLSPSSFPSPTPNINLTAVCPLNPIVAGMIYS